MAKRPIFITTYDKCFFQKVDIEFDFFSGFSLKQQQRSIRSLHDSFNKIHPVKNVLEISTKSENELGVSLSAFNLLIKTKSGKEFSVESAFQASKVFEKGGPYEELLLLPSKQAKKDERLKNSGKIISFKFDKRVFSSEPKTYFYNWLYINTLYLYPELYMKLLKYDAFTDISFNPQKSINCQAESAAIFVSLYKQGLLEEALKNKESFLRVVYPDFNEKFNKQLSFYD